MRKDRKQIILRMCDQTAKLNCDKVASDTMLRKNWNYVAIESQVEHVQPEKVLNKCDRIARHGPPARLAIESQADYIAVESQLAPQL